MKAPRRTPSYLSEVLHGSFRQLCSLCGFFSLSLRLCPPDDQCNVLLQDFKTSTSVAHAAEPPPPPPPPPPPSPPPPSTY